MESGCLNKAIHPALSFDGTAAFAVVPGVKVRIPVWFRAKKTGVYDLVCAELCGWGHYKMKGRLVVETQAEYDAWLKKMTDESNVTQTQQRPAVAEE